MTAALMALMALIGACGPGDRGDDGTAATLRVFAAASLTDAMSDLVMAFERNDPGTTVELNLAGSPTLRAQILEGAPADVVATANPAVLDDLVAAGMVGPGPAVFATNRLVLALAPGNPGRIDGLADLTDSDLFLGLCASGVPCGDLADRTLTRAGIEAQPDTREPDVRALLTKVAAGELDVGLVYATDLSTELARAEGVDGLELEPDLDAVTRYPAAVLAGAAEPERATAFVEFLVGGEGQAILADHGFGPP